MNYNKIESGFTCDGCHFNVDGACSKPLSMQDCIDESDTPFIFLEDDYENRSDTYIQ